MISQAVPKKGSLAATIWFLRNPHHWTSDFSVIHTASKWPSGFQAIDVALNQTFWFLNHRNRHEINICHLELGLLISESINVALSWSPDLWAMDGASNSASISEPSMPSRADLPTSEPSTLPKTGLLASEISTMLSTLSPPWTGLLTPDVHYLQPP